MRIARYLRVSTDDQRADLQDDETYEYAMRRGWVIADTFRDQGVSGTKARRPELDRMMAAARARKIDAILVWRSDRLFRSLHHMVNAMAELEALGVAFVSCTEPFDTTTPAGKLMLHMVSAMSQFERDVLVERVRAGIGAARRRGVKMGRRPSAIDLDEARALLASGLPMPEVASRLGASERTLYRRMGEIRGQGLPEPT